MDRGAYQRAVDSWGVDAEPDRTVLFDSTTGTGDRVQLHLIVEEFYGDGLSGDTYRSPRDVRLVREDGEWRIDQALVWLDQAAIEPFSKPRSQPMQTARRLYVFLLCGVGLGALVIGVTMCSRSCSRRWASVPRARSSSVARMRRAQQLTLASAVTVVSLPVWLIHWFAAERSVRPDRPNASIERTSDVRGLYFALALGALLLAMATGVAGMLEAIVLTVAGAETFARSVGGSLAMALVAGAAWGYHVLLRTRDWSRGAMTDAGAWLPRTYLYVAMFAGLFLLLSGVTGFIELLGRIILDEPPAFIDSSSGPWWAFPLAGAVTGVVVGGAIWFGPRVVREPIAPRPRLAGRQ